MRRFALVLPVLLAGCAVSPPAPVVTGAPVDIERVTGWSAAGRMAIAVADEGGSGSFTWVQDGNRTDLQVRGPLGAGALRVVAEGASLSVTDGEGTNVDAEAARAQLRSRIGTDLPLAEMRYWLLGLPAPSIPAQVTEGQAGSRTVAQAGWTITYDRFVEAQGWSVPARLTATSGAVRVKVIVERWSVSPPGTSGSAGGVP